MLTQAHNRTRPPVPLMKSIWLDEDDETEKLYGPLGESWLDNSSDTDNEELGVKLIKSNKPVLNNKKNIELRKPNCKPRDAKVKTSQSYSATNTKDSKKKKPSVFNLFRVNLSRKPKTISSPFDFQHISHADAKNSDKHDTDINTQDCKQSIKTNNEIVTGLIPASKVNTMPITSYNTTSAISNTPITPIKGRQSEIFKLNHSVSRSTSRASSNLSQNGFSRRRNITSTSTMATSVLETPLQLTKQNQLSPLQDFQEEITNDSSIYDQYNLLKPSLAYDISPERFSALSDDSMNNFLKDYDFPTLLEDEQSFVVIDNLNSQLVFEKSEFLDHNVNKARSSVARRNSDSQILNNGFVSPRKTQASFRKSVDNIYDCYYDSCSSKGSSPPEQYQENWLSSTQQLHSAELTC